MTGWRGRGSVRVMRIARTDPEHEGLCRRCGVSCHAAVPIGGVPVVVPGLHCRYLEEDGGRFRCGVYERRLEVAPWCRTADEAVAQGLVAQDCPYAAGVDGYRGKVVVHRRLLAQVLPGVRRGLAEQGAPGWVSAEGCVRLLEGGGGRWEAARDEAADLIRFRRVDEGGAPE